MSGTAVASVPSHRPVDRPTAAEPDPLDGTPPASDVVVVGAGVMGSWTAWFARAGGAGPDGRHGGNRSVTLIDAWGAGHPRGTSSDETRITRA